MDIFKAFDTLGGEVVLHGGPRVWALIAHFVHGTFSQVRCGSDLSEPWQDSGIAQGRVLSPFLFNIVVERVSLMASWDSHFAGQLYADDLVVVADSAADLQTDRFGCSVSMEIPIPVHVRSWAIQMTGTDSSKL